MCVLKVLEKGLPKYKVIIQGAGNRGCGLPDNNKSNTLFIHINLAFQRLPAIAELAHGHEMY